jgi:hypothetical protein
MLTDFYGSLDLKVGDTYGSDLPMLTANDVIIIK